MPVPAPLPFLLILTFRGLPVLPVLVLPHDPPYVSQPLLLSLLWCKGLTPYLPDMLLLKKLPLLPVVQPPFPFVVA